MVDFKGKTVVCIASGPSLNAADCQLVAESGLPSIAVNNSWEMAKFSDVIYAGDAQWWISHYHEIDSTAEKWTCSKSAYDRFKNMYLEMNYFRVPEKAHQTGWNSGLRAIELAVMLGAEKILLMGYDCSVKHGVHWHGPHTKTLNPDHENCSKWQVQFERIAIRMKTLGVTVINCSRYTELKAFPVSRLETEIIVGDEYDSKRSCYA